MLFSSAFFYRLFLSEFTYEATLGEFFPYLFPHCCVSRCVCMCLIVFVSLSSQDFNLCLLAPCLSVGLQRLCRDQGAFFFETALHIMFERLAGVTALLPSPHQPLLLSAPPTADSSYWNAVCSVYGEAEILLGLGEYFYLDIIYINILI